MEFSQLFSFDLVDTSLVASAFELGVEPDADDFEREGFGHRACPHGNTVGVVVFLRHLRGPLIPAEAAADAFDLVGNYGFAVTGATEHDAIVGLAGSDGFGRRADEIRVVAGLIGVAAAVDHLAAAFLKQSDDGCFEGEACVVGADGDGKGFICHEVARLSG